MKFNEKAPDETSSKKAVLRKKLLKKEAQDDEEMDMEYRDKESLKRAALNKPALKRRGINRPGGGLAVILLLAAALWLFYGGYGVQAAPAKVNWEMVSETGDQLYPSMIVVFSTAKMESKREPTTLGSPLGIIGVSIKSPAANTPVKVEISSTKLIKKSVFEGVMPKAGATYDIFPQLKYDYDKLFEVRQTFPEDVTAVVTVNGVPQGEKTMTMTVMSLNDCVFALYDRDETVDICWMYAAYVNENHPLVEKILKEALEKDTDSFSGYQGNAEEVKEEIEAIWNAVQARGVKYSDVSVPSADSDFLSSQHVRLLGDSLAGKQANCVDGTVLLASILKKIGLNTYLMATDDHMYLGVDLTEDGKKRIYIETTLLDDTSLDEAIKSGTEQYNNDKKKKDGLIIVDVDAARDMGIMPLKDVGSKAK